MNVSSRRLASASVPPARNILSRSSNIALLPPIPLYRRLLRAHRRFLPRDMRLLGDEYVKAEFRAHRNVDNPVHIIAFLTEWQLYAQEVEGNTWRGGKIDREKLEKLSDEQIGQLYELMKAAQARGGDDGESEP